MVRGKKKTRSVLTQTPKSLLRYLWMLEPVTFIAPFLRGEWMSKNPNYKSNNDNEDNNNNDKNDDDNANKKALRRDCCVKRYTRHITRVHWGGGMELVIRSRAEISGSEKRAPHDVHDYSSLSPCLNIHLEVYI